MDKFIPKFNLYETLAMLIPGATILCTLCIYLQNCTNIQSYLEEFLYNIRYCNLDPLVIKTSLFLILSYLVGVLQHSLMNWFFNGLRNNQQLIGYSLYKLESRNEYKFLTHNKEELQDDKICDVCFEKCCKWRGEWCKKRWYSLHEERCYDCPIRIVIVNGVFVLIASLKGMFCNKKSTSFFDSKLTDLYYEAYYYVAKQGQTGFINIERQIHFIRNMLIPLLFLFCCIEGSSGIKTLGIIFIVFLYFLMIERQHKVHEMIFEDYEYLKRLEVSDFSLKKCLAKKCDEQALNTSGNNAENSNNSKECPEKCCFEKFREAFNPVP